MGTKDDSFDNLEVLLIGRICVEAGSRDERRDQDRNALRIDHRLKKVSKNANLYSLDRHRVSLKV